MEGNPQPNQDLKTELTEMLKGVDPPEMCEVDEQCIYKVPPSIREAHPQAYTPKTISIGPFHNPRRSDATRDNNNILWSMEDLKLKYLRGFLNRTGLSVEAFVPKLKELENSIRNCYAGGPIIYNSNDFLKIIITDVCFIIELFLRCHFPFENVKNDPILSKPWLLGHILIDLIPLENQLPFFVLKDIYEFAGLNQICNHSFIKITTFYFDVFNRHNINTENVSPKHFVDLLRIFLKPSTFVLGQKNEQENPIPCCSQCAGVFQFNFYYLPKKKKEQENNLVDHVYSASQLSQAGLKFEVSTDSKCLLDLKFDDRKGVLKMPRFDVDDTTEIHLGNILAFEECHYPNSGYINQYMTIVDYLINGEKDANILIDNGIIVNLMGDASLVATVITDLNKNISMQDLNPDYLSLCNRLNAFYKNPRNKYKAICIQEYFDTPWKTASTIAAVLLLILTLIQTIGTVWDFHKDKKTRK